jgi:hypothetical protein
MYLRFVGHQKDETSGQPAGIFQLAEQLLDGDQLDGDERTELRALMEWFKHNLPAPTRLSPYRDGWRRGYRDSWHRRRLAICWFKPEAQEHIERGWQMARILRQHGIAVEMVRTRRAGYVTYEDEWQVVAMPFVNDD